MNDIMRRLQHGLIVSCQALEMEPLFGSDLMVKMALAAKSGGAHGIRANSPKDIQAIRAVVDLPLIGLYKYRYPRFCTFITPTFFEARQVAEAGADIIAIDATADVHPRETVGELIELIHRELGLLVLADVATVAEAREASLLGADLVATTMCGYTKATREMSGVCSTLLRDMVAQTECPVIAEGNIRTPSAAKEMIDAGAFAVVVGSAITRPQTITSWFAEAMLTGDVRDE